MHEESYSISTPAATALNAASRIVAVGTTVTRVLESQPPGPLKSCAGRTSIFIHPPYSFQKTGALLTNFHLPESTLLMLVSAFATREAVLNAYWLEARDIEDRTVLREIGANVGLDADALVDAIDDPNYIEQVDADINLARTYGLQGVPALIFEQKYLIPGAVPVATLRQAVEQVQQERAQ
jgi:hypothetical protein